MRSPRRLAILLALAVFAATLGACGHAPNAPVVTEPAVSSQAAKPVAEEAGLIGAVVGGLQRLLIRTLELVGSLGGSLTNGRWKVEIPAGAVNGTARVTLGVLSPAAGECQLEIYPASANDFAVPVRITANCAGVPDSELRDWVIFWFNPQTRRWVEVPGSTVDLRAKTVSAPLEHFSTYAAGKRGSKASW